MMLRKSAIGLHRSDSSTISENGEGAKFGGRLGTLRGVVHDRLRHLLDDVAACGRPHQAGNADPLAALHQHFGQRKGHDQRALELAVGQRGGKSHRRRTVGPDPDRVRGFPFALAHIEMIVARRAPPIDVVGRLARHEAAVLPEILAGAGAAAAVQAVDDGGGDAARFQNEPRHGVGELAALPTAA